MAKTKNTARKAADAAKTAKAIEAEAVKTPAPVVEPETVETPAPVEAPAVVVDKAPEYVIVALNHPFGVKFRVTDKHGLEHVVVINGNATGLRGLEKGVLPSGGAYGFTPNVDAELWDAVVAKYGDKHPLFRNRLIFSTADTRSAKAEAKTLNNMRTGFEAVEPADTATVEE